MMSKVRSSLFLVCREAGNASHPTDQATNEHASNHNSSVHHPDLTPPAPITPSDASCRGESSGKLCSVSLAGQDRRRTAMRARPYSPASNSQPVHSGTHVNHDRTHAWSRLVATSA